MTNLPTVSAIAPESHVRASSPLLQIENLSREFAGRDVVSGISLRLRRGEVLGLLGLNGAGKSTTLSMLCGVLAPSTGWVRINGLDTTQFPDQARACIGYLPDIPPLHPELRVAEYVDYCARLHRMKGPDATKAVHRALDLCQLGDVRDRRIGNLSKGYRQRVGLAQAIVHSPELLVLDEPASGLDPVQLMAMRDLIRELSKDCAVIFSSHLLPEVTDVCHRVAIIHEGRLVHEESLDKAPSGTHYQLNTATPLQGEILRQVPGITRAQPDEDPLQWHLTLQPQSSPKVISALVDLGAKISSFSPHSDNLEARFAALTTGRPGTGNT